MCWPMVNPISDVRPKKFPKYETSRPFHWYSVTYKIGYRIHIIIIVIADLRAFRWQITYY